MGKDNTTNFATSALNGTISPSATTFTVTASTGHIFPTVDATHPNNFKVVIDSEVILCSGRTGDTFTVAQRGAEGTSATTHADTTPVVHAFSSGMLDHLWQNVADTFNAAVPGYARVTPVAPGAYDDEFESQSGAWTITPTPASGDVIDFNVIPSCMRFSRAPFSTTSYFAYKTFTPGANTKFDIICRMASGGRNGNYGSGTQPNISAILYVSDQTVPSGLDGGNQAYMGYNESGYLVTVNDPAHIAGGATFSANAPALYCGKVVSGHFASSGYALAQGYTYLRIRRSDTNEFTFWFGDGLSWNLLGLVTQTINVATLGFRFIAVNGSSATTDQQVVVDFLRVTVGSYSSFY